MTLFSRITSVILALVFALSCSNEPPKFKIKRASDYEPLPAAAKPPPPVGPAPTATAGETIQIIETGGFRGRCEYRYSGINDETLIVLASASGMQSYRLAGIAIPDAARRGVLDQIAAMLENQALGIETELADPGTEPAIYIYRCADASMLNLALVREGLAVPNDQPTRYREMLSSASLDALTNRRGVWATSSN